MLLNLSNHPSIAWPDAQKETVRKGYGSVQDLAFPVINPEWEAKEVLELAQRYCAKCLDLLNQNQSDPENAVHIMGEHTFSFVLITLLQKEGVKCIASTTERISKDLGNEERQVQFHFVKFRVYPKL